ncbi:MAG: glutamate--tRNA ligase [Bacteroidales bacterium]|jgi:glutamyl-tRNA synthetase|nr:glutamate--tRNA ligase [Bacteroidales bacterium]MDD4703283.1 glutamate--tRNA ligase [Bacteroidales bacterium]MDX9798588.1 glutamate--tRNA ligase [Bacteroidales bacterium]
MGIIENKDKDMEKQVRVRFAPSPTGPLHIGGVRTALYNYLFAKKHNGQFILRIEDTDQGRLVSGAEEYIIETFDWLGIKFDEGIREGGSFAPYRQSDRKSIYKDYAMQLVEKGWAYYAFDTPEELEAIRKTYELEKKNFQYDNLTRTQMRNSISLNQTQVKELLDKETPYVIRFKFPENTEIKLHDMIRKEVVMNTNILDDKVLYKSDGMPTYHLANVVDDHLMQITHVIRGEEWLPSCPLHVMLYKAFGWENTMPQFAHLPLLLKPDGNGKLSKRDGDRLGFPVFPLQWEDPKTQEISSGYRESGYLPKAVINFLALLGWNPGGEKELFKIEELIDLFSMERISKGGAKFDLEKAKWFNHQYIQMEQNQTLAKELLKVLAEKNLNFPMEYVEKVVGQIKERCNFTNDFWDQSYFFFIAPNNYDEKVVKKHWKAETPTYLEQITQLLNSNTYSTTEEIDHLLHDYIKDNDLNMGNIMNTLRLVLVGKSMGPSISEIIFVIGKEETLGRIGNAIKHINI